MKELDQSWRMYRSVTPQHLLIYITSGRLVYWVNEEPFPLQKGDILYIPAGSERRGAAIERHQRYAVSFSATGESSGLLPILTSRRACKLRLRNPAYFKQRFSLLTHHWQNKSSSFQNATCYAILLEMMTIVNTDSIFINEDNKKSRLIEDIKHYILQNYRNAIKLKDLSDYSGRSPNYISYVFKEMTGFTPIEYLHDVRISLAKDMMLSRSMSIREIAEQTGFCDQAYFNRVFKKVAGLPPSSFLNKSG
jgi:AraC family transcriptional regulator of arabinose operon